MGTIRMGFALRLIVALLCVLRGVGAGESTDIYVTPEGNGGKSGTDFANALPFKEIQKLLDAAQPGATVRLGSGVYTKSMTLNASGKGKDSVITLMGVGTGNGLPIFRGKFDKNRAEKTNSLAIGIGAGVSYVVVRDIVVEDHGRAVLLKGKNKGVRIENVDVKNSRDGFWIDGGATAGVPDSGSHELLFKDCDTKGYTKRGFRLFGGNTDVHFINCHADGGGKEWATEIFPIGFHINGGENGIIDRRITYTDCTASNNYHDGGKKYWNADGFCSEKEAAEITYIRCGSFNNTDGGWDVKTAGTKLIDCYAVGNKKNYRLWANENPTTLENCLSAFSAHHGGVGKPGQGIWIHAGASIKLTNCTMWGDGASIAVEDGTEEKPTRITLEKCLVISKEGGKAQSFSAGVKVDGSGSIVGGTAELIKPSKDWRGGDDAFDGKSNPDVGYKFKKTEK